MKKRLTIDAELNGCSAARALGIKSQRAIQIIPGDPMGRVVVINPRCELAPKISVVLSSQRKKVADQLPTLLRCQRCGLRFDLLEAHGGRVIRITHHAISGSLRAVYSRLLEKVRLDRWRVFDCRYSLGKFTKLWLVLRGWLGALG